jgi:hypothetical protein
MAKVVACRCQNFVDDHWPLAALLGSLSLTRPVSKSRESELKNKTSRAGTVPDFMGVRDLLAR